MNIGFVKKPNKHHRNANKKRSILKTELGFAEKINLCDRSELSRRNRQKIDEAFITRLKRGSESLGKILTVIGTTNVAFKLKLWHMHHHSTVFCKYEG